MSRIINPNSAGKERKQLARAVVLAIRELMVQTEPNPNIFDPAAFIAIVLDLISATIDQSVGPWEKRGYWLKADKFRLEWEWTETLGKEMNAAVIAEDLGRIATAAAKIGEKLYKVEVPKRHRMGTPWVGAWDKLKSQTRK